MPPKGSGTIIYPPPQKKNKKTNQNKQTRKIKNSTNVHDWGMSGVVKPKDKSCSQNPLLIRNSGSIQVDSLSKCYLGRDFRSWMVTSIKAWD